MLMVLVESQWRLFVQAPYGLFPIYISCQMVLIVVVGNSMTSFCSGFHIFDILPYHILILLNYKKKSLRFMYCFQFFYCINWISYSRYPSEFWPRKVLNPRFPLLPYGPVLTILKYTQILVLFHLFKSLSLHCSVIKHLKVLKSEKSPFCVQSPK